MSISKSVQKIIFLAVMAISAVLLCFVGVWASQNALNLKFTGIVNPDIICKIEVKSTSTETYTTLFDNSGDGKPEDYLDTQNRLKNFTTTLDGTIATGLDFKLTNYTPTKHIRLSIQNILIDGENLAQENLQATHTSASAEKMAAAPNTGEFTLSFSANKADTFNVSLSLVVEEVYMVSTSGVGLGNPDKFFFAEDETPRIPLFASVSYQLPQSITFNKLVSQEITPFTKATNNYTRTNNTEGLATFDKIDLKDNVSIVCDCNRVFLVEKNSNASLFENGQTTTSFDNTKTYMPNNGKYSYSADFAQVIKADGFKEYPYYITLGEYPQSQVYDIALISTLNDSASLLFSANRTINGAQCLISWYGYNGQKYVKSTIIPYGSTINDEFIETAWFKVEPISWVVLEAEQKNGKTIDLGTLYYSETDKMLYQDQLCGKPFSGKLLLMSAYALDTSAFNTGLLDYANFYESDIQDFLSDTIASAYTLEGNSILKHMLEAGVGENYLEMLLLSTYSQTSSGYSTSNIETSLFMLAGHDQSTETYHASKYFSGAPEKDTSIFTSSLAATSPTDYAIAHYAETSASDSTSSDVNAYNNPDNYASPRGWAVGATSATTATCTYWTRSAQTTPNSTMAKVVNTRGSIKATDITDPHITVRPCMVLDIGFYYNGIFNYYS